MASRIESDSPSKALRRRAEEKVPLSASSKPTAPGLPPKPIPKRGAPPPMDGHAGTELAEDHEARPGRGLFGQIPAWGISMLVHVIAILVMALMAGETVRIEKPTVITSSVSEEEGFDEFEDPQDAPEETTEDFADPVAEVMVTTESSIEPIEVAAVSDAAESALMAADLAEFDSETASVSDIMQTIGAAGMDIGGGFGARVDPGARAMARGGGPDTEAAVDRALKWFAKHQLPDGGWDFRLENCPGCNCRNRVSLADRSSATSMALLPFLGRGYTHLEGKYQKQVDGGIRFLLKTLAESQSPALPAGGNLYTQALVGIALSECYALSKDNELAAPTQVVLNAIKEAQDPVGGGWRYEPKQAGDISSVGWQIMALQSGSKAGFPIDPVTLKRAGEFLDSVQGDEQGATYNYDLIEHPDTNQGRSAIGLLCRMYMGWPKNHPGLQRGALELAKVGPTTKIYNTYYATQVMHHLEGDLWRAWNAKLKPMLLKSQSTQGHEAGSWDLNSDEYHDGRLYYTALATLTLEVYYRHIPLYSTQSAKEKFRD